MKERSNYSHIICPDGNEVQAVVWTHTDKDSYVRIHSFFLKQASQTTQVHLLSSHISKGYTETEAIGSTSSVGRVRYKMNLEKKKS